MHEQITIVNFKKCCTFCKCVHCVLTGNVTGGVLIKSIQRFCYCYIMCLPFYTEQDRLFFTVYERAKLDERSTEPHFWIYRPRISLEHLHQNLLASNHQKKFTVLYTFIQEVCCIQSLVINSSAMTFLTEGTQFESYTLPS